MSHTLTLNDVEFNTDHNIITAYTASYTEIIIPDNFDGVPVDSIGNGAFKDKGLTKVTLPSTIDFIGYEAFNGNSFKQITIPTKKMSINCYAFDHGVAKVIENKDPNCISFANDSLNIFNPCANELICEIAVDSFDTLQSLHTIADCYIKLSENLDNTIELYGIEFEYDQLDYTISVFAKDGLYAEGVFEHFIGNQELEEKIVTYVKNVIAWCQEHQITLWQTEEIPLAEYAAYILAESNPSYIPLYYEVMLNEREQEGTRSKWTENLISKYGFIDNILVLIAHRLGGAIGQLGPYHLSNHQQPIIDLLSQRPDLKSLFLDTAVKSIYHSHHHFDDILEFVDTLIDSDLIEGDSESWLDAQLQKLT